MATIHRVAGGWRVEVRHKTKDGAFYRTARFETRQQAQVWGGRTEAEYQQQRKSPSKRTLRDALEKYRGEVSPTHRGHRWERLRIEVLIRDKEWAAQRIERVTPADIGEWRDRRLKDVSGSSVRREMALLSGIFESARREWRWIASNPVKDARKPAAAAPRDRRITPLEEKNLIRALGYFPGASPQSVSDHAALAFLFALETAMRAGEIVGLTWERVDLAQRFVHIPLTKNGTARDVPLTPTAVALLELLPRGSRVFQVTSASLDALFRKARKRAKIRDLHFHDSRHEAITRLAGKIPVMDLARMTGHKQLGQLMRYYNPSAADIAKRLSAADAVEVEADSPARTGSPRKPTSGARHSGRPSARRRRENSPA